MATTVSASLKTLDLNSRKLAYWERPGSGLPVLMIHGLGGNHAGLVPLAERLSRLPLIIPDLPGYGGSQHLRSAHSVGHYADIMATMLRRLDLPSCDVIGHSFGSAVSLILAARYPDLVRRLVLVTPPMVEGPGWLGRLGQSLYEVAGRSPEPVRSWLLTSPLSVRLTDGLVARTPNKAIREQIIREDISNYANAGDRVLLEGYRSFYQTPLINYGRRIKAPTLLIAGQFDSVAPVPAVKYLAEQVPVSQLAVVAAGHFVPMEAPELLVPEITQFLD